MITEHSTKINGTLPTKDVTAKMDVFYNPVMVSNRNISITLLTSISNKEMNIALPLAGSGIRGLRFCTELKKGKIKRLFVNDKKETFVKTFTDNIQLNKIKKDISIHNEEASLFLLNQPGFDYIDIDAFGSPNPFLAAAVARISRNGILAITATDTAALTGTYPKVTKRKYWARNIRTPWMHELGLRILIRKVQLQGIQFDKALTPILAYHKNHYFRVYFRCEKGKMKCDDLVQQHQYFLSNTELDFEVSNYNMKKSFDYCGPLWTGKLFDVTLLKKMVKNNKYKEDQKFLELLLEESNVDMVGYHDMHALARKKKKNVPKFDELLKKGARTHFSPYGIKTKNKIRI